MEWRRPRLLDSNSANIMLCIICDKEFSAGQKAEELYSHAEDEHGLSREDYDKVDNYVLEGEGGGGKERDAPPPRPTTTGTAEQPPFLLCVVCESEFGKGDEEQFWAHVGGEHGLSKEEYEKIDNLDRVEEEEGGQGKSEKGEQGTYATY